MRSALFTSSIGERKFDIAGEPGNFSSMEHAGFDCQQRGRLWTVSSECLKPGNHSLMSQHNYDALVIGGGPGGSTAAALSGPCRQESPPALEKEVFPVSHIGDSLLPTIMRLFGELGLIPALRPPDFQKNSAPNLNWAMVPMRRIRFSKWKSQ